MSDVSKHISLPKIVATANDLDYSFLRKKGLEYIEQLSHKIWTDYNSHDPGVTILEMLAYAITDLGMRTSMPIENLLSPSEEESEENRKQFFTASEILPSAPVTRLDYRKLFIDIEGVKNCWIAPYYKKAYADCRNFRLSYNKEDFIGVDNSFIKDFQLQGLYSVLVDLEEPDPDKFPTKALKDQEAERIFEEIRLRYHANRNLCEDMVSVAKVKTHPVAVCASIEILPGADEELVHARVLHAIDLYFSSDVRFYSLNQMLSKGYTVDQIFEGPLLQRGFIDKADLEASELRKEVRLSDIIKRIMDIEGVKLIRDISIRDCAKPGSETGAWVICINEGRKPARCADSAFSYFKDVLPVNINPKRVKAHLKEIFIAEQTEQELAKYNMEPIVPKGEYLGTSETTTIQNDFPDTYGIGRNGLPQRVGPVRLAQAKQLKGYLLFYDQIFATYFAQLGKVMDLLSVNQKPGPTYFTQAVSGVKDFEELISNYPIGDDEELTRLLLGDLDNHIERKNRILDHLIARFAEKFSDYAFLMKQLYGDYADQAILQTKNTFLKDYHQTGRTRGSAFNGYKQPVTELWDTDNISGFQKRIARLCGIKNYNRRNLSRSFVEIYSLDNSGGEKVYRWRIRNLANKIVMSATEHYSAPKQAENEMNKSILKIIETDPDLVREVFQHEIVDETIAGNLQVQVSATGKYSFNVIDSDANPIGSQWVIARHFTYYNTVAELKNAILNLIEFMVESFSEEGMFVVEHILLRPDVTSPAVPLKQFMHICDDDCNGCGPLDPYSYRVTIVLPGWTYRFFNTDFRNYLENLIRKELPAHILARICWVGYRAKQVSDDENHMMQFEAAFRRFLVGKTNLGQGQNENNLIKLIDIMGRLNSVYPSGTLMDCADEDEDLKGKVILGRTNIGNL
jgi:uncharacterized protein